MIERSAADLVGTWKLPRPLSRLELLLLETGARVDRFVLDRVVRRHAFAAQGAAPALRERLARALEFYRDPRFVAEPERFFTRPTSLRTDSRRLADLRGGEILSLRYTTDFVPVFPEAQGDTARVARNQRGIARWWRHHEPGHPAMLCVHGFAGGHLWLERLAFEADRFYRAGLDVVLYVLPYHGPRTPRGAQRSGAPFFDIDLVQTNEAFAQAVYELRALLAYLLAQGTGPVGAFGMSLGGYTTALLASVEPALAFAVPMIPLAALAEMMWSQGEGDPRLALAIEHGWSREALHDFLRVHAPLARPPLVAKDRRLIIAALGDRICPPAQADTLWRHWDCPRIHWYPGGHLAQFGRGVALREVRTLLRDAGLLARR
jgi:pimeloyl-ACP methyl ester carboxylesterase